MFRASGNSSPLFWGSGVAAGVDLSAGFVQCGEATGTMARANGSVADDKLKDAKESQSRTQDLGLESGAFSEHLQNWRKARRKRS